jgi:hypothetical protein
MVFCRNDLGIYSRGWIRKGVQAKRGVVLGCSFSEASMSVKWLLGLSSVYLKGYCFMAKGQAQVLAV